MITLGQTCMDRITGFKGVATGRVEYLTGCNQVLLTPRVKEDGTVPEAHWYDEQRLVVLDEVEIIVLENGATPGFDKPAPKY